MATKKTNEQIDKPVVQVPSTTSERQKIPTKQKKASKKSTEPGAEKKKAATNKGVPKQDIPATFSKPLKPVGKTKEAKEVKPSVKNISEAKTSPVAKIKKATSIAKTIAEEPVVKAKKVTSKKAVAVQSAATISITFQLRFTSKFGQVIYIMGNHDKLGNNEVATAVQMQYFNHEFWYASIEVPKDLAETINYKYYVKNEDGTISMEWGNDKQIKISDTIAENILIIDSWNFAGYYENSFYTEPFKKVLLKDNFTSINIERPITSTHTFKIKAPLLPKNHVPCLSGSLTQLGTWDPASVLVMSKQQDEDWYQVHVDLTNATFPVLYKYGVYNNETRELVQFESGDNRIVYDVAAPNKLTILADGFIKLPNDTFKGAGVAIPVFSLRTKNSFGVGEFEDLKLLVDWSKQVGIKLIQVLPINDTTATHSNADSYPYAAISAFALHPVYLHLPAVVGKENTALLSSLEKTKVKLNASEVVDYYEVVKAKLAFVKEIFPQQKQTTFSSEEFNSFFTTNAHWLVPYAAFCYLRDEYGTADFEKWPQYNTFDVFEINGLATPVLTTNDNISIHYFIQYHLHVQLKSATGYAHKNGVVVKGDIPIGIFRNSCDAWQQPQLYNMDMQAGAPPDDFAVAGQNWGFPTYNWQRMSEDGFSWWKNRFAQMSFYFDAFRIDHILGFFRIWSIPMHAVEGIMGYFVPAIPIHINEFNERRIWFDHYRYTKPFINDSVLAEVFGENAESVKNDYLEKKMFDNYELVPDFDTQRKVESHFASLEQNATSLNIKQGLFTLISNVILFEVDGSQGQQYHFRIAVENTSSFKYLEEGTKYQLKELYLNYFYRRQDDFWMREAMYKLPELKRSTNMLICGEDLGMVPACVPGVMKNLGMLSLEIQRMPKDPTKEFFHPNDAPYLSVVTPSTHDMSTIRGWWEEDRQKTQKFYNVELGKMGNAPYFCESWINKAIILQHLYSPAMWSIFQVQDLLGISDNLRRENPAEERINIPSDPQHYWQYRMHIALEDLIGNKEFNSDLLSFIQLSGR